VDQERLPLDGKLRGKLRHSQSAPSFRRRLSSVSRLFVQGHIKFWKKKAGEIEFIKRYAAHLGPVTSLAVAYDGAWLASISSKDCVLNVFDVVNFDMVNRIQLDFSPSCIEWIHKSASSKPTLAVGCIGRASQLHMAHKLTTRPCSASVASDAVCARCLVLHPLPTILGERILCAGSIRRWGHPDI